MLYLLVVGIQALDATGVFVSLIDGRLAPLGHGGCGDFYLVELANALHVGHLQVPGPALSETFVGLARLLGKDEARVGGKTFELLAQLLLHTLSAPHQGYKHEDAPEDAESRQQTACFVSSNGDEDFLTSIFIYSHNIVFN